MQSVKDIAAYTVCNLVKNIEVQYTIINAICNLEKDKQYALCNLVKYIL